MAKKKYPNWKKSLHEGWRVFGLAFGSVFLAQLSGGIDFNDWQAWLFNLLVSALAAGLKATVDYIRREYFSKQYKNVIYKLPL